MFSRLYHLNPTAAKKRATELLEQFSLTDAAKRPIRTYSGGMRRRLDLAASLIVRPKVLFLDEPTTGLDPITSKEIIQLMKSVQETYKTSSIIITHDIDCARVVADRMILLIDGKNYIEGTFDEISKSEDPKVKAFFK